jgi:hypothetical protein
LKDRLLIYQNLCQSQPTSLLPACEKTDHPGRLAEDFAGKLGALGRSFMLHICMLHRLNILNSFTQRTLLLGAICRGVLCRLSSTVYLVSLRMDRRARIQSSSARGKAKSEKLEDDAGIS